ncbi:uncharacterized protein LOC143544235 [Bidens hawaiensis]|uniref:uncharacterized protein LOC143544235 n=1 Tax=Bidens hawaiensis TaxID=980011 RepID=UPI00404A620F
MDQSVDSISVGFNTKLDLNSNGDESTSQLLPDLKAHHEHEHEDDDDDFTFMLIGDDDAPIHEDKLLPLFDQKLLLDDGEYELEEIDRLPNMPPVDKIFIESPRGLPSSESEQNDDDEDITAGAYCSWSGDSAAATAELSEKSNSTGFSKLWRLKEKVGRSYSDGRDAFVFLKCSDKSAAATANPSSDGTFVKVTGGKARVVKPSTKGKKATGYEAYLRSRGEYTEEERRRSYLPYRPEMLGLFTNVHGGLTKNVHPY